MFVKLRILNRWIAKSVSRLEGKLGVFIQVDGEGSTSKSATVDGNDPEYIDLTETVKDGEHAHLFSGSKFDFTSRCCNVSLRGRRVHLACRAECTRFVTPHFSMQIAGNPIFVVYSN